VGGGGGGGGTQVRRAWIDYLNKQLSALRHQNIVVMFKDNSLS
jgi:hypothetical protein